MCMYVCVCVCVSVLERTCIVVQGCVRKGILVRTPYLSSAVTFVLERIQHPHVC